MTAIIASLTSPDVDDKHAHASDDNDGNHDDIDGYQGDNADNDGSPLMNVQEYHMKSVLKEEHSDSTGGVNLKTKRISKSHDWTFDKDEKIYICKKCEFATKHRSSMCRHSNIHSSKIGCPRCDKWFDSQEELNEHLPVHDYMCEKCSRRFKCFSGLYKHKMSQHVDTPRYTCEWCSKGFHVEREYRDHLNTHSKERPYICEECAATFSYYNSYARHKKTCKGAVADRPQQIHQCPFCDVIVKSKDILTDHIRGTHEHKTLICRCGKIFRWRGSLSKHKKKCTHFSKAD